MGRLKETPYLTIMRKEARKRDAMLKKMKRGQKIYFTRNDVRDHGWFVENLTEHTIKVVNSRGLLESIEKKCLCEARNAPNDTDRENEQWVPSGT